MRPSTIAFIFSYILEGRARYAGLPLAPLAGIGLWSRLFFGPSVKNRLFMLVLPNLGQFQCSVVTLVIFSCKLNNFEKFNKVFFIQINCICLYRDFISITRNDDMADILHSEAGVTQN